MHGPNWLSAQEGLGVTSVTSSLADFVVGIRHMALAASLTKVRRSETQQPVTASDLCAGLTRSQQ